MHLLPRERGGEGECFLLGILPVYDSIHQNINRLSVAALCLSVSLSPSLSLSIDMLLSLLLSLSLSIDVLLSLAVSLPL